LCQSCLLLADCLAFFAARFSISDFSGAFFALLFWMLFSFAMAFEIVWSGAASLRQYVLPCGFTVIKVMRIH